jgi:hypothetical protein
MDTTRIGNLEGKHAKRWINFGRRPPCMAGGSWGAQPIPCYRMCNGHPGPHSRFLNGFVVPARHCGWHGNMWHVFSKFSGSRVPGTRSCQAKSKTRILELFLHAFQALHKQKHLVYASAQISDRVHTPPHHLDHYLSNLDKRINILTFFTPVSIVGFWQSALVTALVALHVA